MLIKHISNTAAHTSCKVLSRRSKDGNAAACHIFTAMITHTRLNKSLISIEELANKYDVQELKEMITEHAKTTGSAKGKYILEHFSEYLPKFKKIIPNDYKRMLNAIVQMEEKGLSSEQAQIEAFYANAGRK